MRSIFFSLLLMFSLSVSLVAQPFAEIPKSTRILSVEEVKNFWINSLPVPEEPSGLSDSYGKMVSYHQNVGTRHRLIQAIEAGRHDELATKVRLRHNIVAYRLVGNDDKVLELSEELAALEAIADQAAAELENADRLERLIAATERLAAAIENNGGVVPEEAQEMVDEIVPFERDRNDRRSIINHLRDEIVICEQPIIVYEPRSSVRHPHYPSQPKVRPARGNTPQVVQPQRSQPKVRPARVNPAQVVQPKRTQPAPSVKAPRQPQVRQPQVPSIRR